MNEKLIITWMIIFLVFILVLGFYILGLKSSEYISSINNKDNILHDDYNNTNKTHFRYMPIKYYIYSSVDGENYTNCSQINYYNLHKAINEFENATNHSITFKEITNQELLLDKNILEDNAIKIYCDNYKWGDGYILAGTGGSSSQGNIIKTGTVNLYHNGIDTKGIDSTQLHELLHVFGYEHINNNQSIMNPINQGKIKIDKEIVSDLMDTYRR